MADLYLKGEGGVVQGYDLPLHEAIKDKVTKGYLRRVDEDGQPYVEPDKPPAPPVGQAPAASALKPEWVGYAVRVHGADPDVAEAMTKQDLIDKYGN